MKVCKLRITHCDGGEVAVTGGGGGEGFAVTGVVG